MNEAQQDHLLRYFVSHREESILPTERFGDEDRIHSSILNLNQSLWIGAGYTPRLYDIDRDEE